MAEFARYTVGKLAGTEPAAQPCFDPVGSLEVATTEEGWADLHRKHGWASSWGVEGARLVNAAECSRLHPLLEQERMRGGLYVASDGLANAVQAGEELARRATSRGARFLGGQTVLDVLSRSGRVTGVVSGSGTVSADLVVLCAGFWGAEIGRMVDLTVPLLPMAHRYALTGSVPPLVDRSAGAARLPIVTRRRTCTTASTATGSASATTATSRSPSTWQASAAPTAPRRCPRCCPSPSGTSRPPGPTPSSCFRLAR